MLLSVLNIGCPVMGGCGGYANNDGVDPSSDDEDDDDDDDEDEDDDDKPPP